MTTKEREDAVKLITRLLNHGKANNTSYYNGYGRVTDNLAVKRYDDALAFVEEGLNAINELREIEEILK